jgi:hypothetical protein
MVRRSVQAGVERGHDYHKGKIDSQVVGKLVELLIDPWQPTNALDELPARHPQKRAARVRYRGRGGTEKGAVRKLTTVV